MKALSISQMANNSAGEMTAEDCANSAKARAVMSAVTLVGSFIPVVGTVIFGTTSAVLVGLDVYCAFQ